MPNPVDEPRAPTQDDEYEAQLHYNAGESEHVRLGRKKVVDDALSPLPGRRLIAGRLKKWQPPYTMGRTRAYLDKSWYRVYDRDGHAVGRYSQFRHAYAVLEFLFDEARLRYGYPATCPPKADVHRWLAELDRRQSIREQDAEERAKLLRQAKAKRQNVKRKSRRQHARWIGDIARLPGTPSSIKRDGD